MAKTKHFSMIRSFHFADWFTLANAASGVGALLAMMSYMQNPALAKLYLACALIPLALVFDVLDGRIARWRQHCRCWASSWIRWPISSLLAWHRWPLLLAWA